MQNTVQKIIFFLLSGLFSIFAVAQQPSQCEFHVSAVAGEYVYHGMANQVFFVKVRDDLKNKVSQIAFYARLDEWQEYKAQFDEKTQTYIVRIGIGAANLDRYTNKNYEGVFFMETTEGTRYWLNNGGLAGLNFYIDGNFARTVSAATQQLHLGNGGQISTIAPSPFSNLNPFLCK